MQWFANLTTAVPDPSAWASAREAEGFDGVACADHLWITGRAITPFPHVWVTLGAMSGATTNVLLQSAFANNLLRHPVEFAQASLAMQAVSGGRFEAGLGAGWAQAEMDATGREFPDGRTRARMLYEAVLINRELLAGRPCQFDGDYYSVDVPALGPAPSTVPPLVVSLGSPWTMRTIAPLVDRVELKMGRATRGGGLDFAALGSVTRDEVAKMVDSVRNANPDVLLSILAFAACGPGVEQMREMLGDDLYGSFTGEPAAVVDALHDLADLGFDRIQLSEWVPGTFAQVAPLLH